MWKTSDRYTYVGAICRILLHYKLLYIRNTYNQYDQSALQQFYPDSSVWNECILASDVFLNR